MRKEIENLSREQKELQLKISTYEEEFEGEKGRKRQLEREINEINIQMNQKKSIGSHNGIGESKEI